MNNQEIKKFKDLISTISNEKEIFDEKNKFSKTFFIPLYDDLKKASVDQKKEKGTLINSYKEEIDQIVSSRLEEVKKDAAKNFVPEYDIYLNTNNINSNVFNPLQIVIERMNQFFTQLSFQIVNGDEVVSEKYNFDHLNIGSDHPAREMHDSFYLPKNLMLRTHCTAISSQMIENNKDAELKIVSFGNVYRNDNDDATHSHQFNQMDIVWLAKGLSVANLKWLIDEMLKFVFESDVKTRYRLSYFPFTEPSFEVDISCFICKSKGCNVCKKTGWIEILGSGILHPNVTEKANLDSDMVGLAAGIGIDRIAMLKFGIKDIRDIYNNNFRLIEQFGGKK